MKVHVALNTPRFDESVRFYRTFLGLEPVKLKPGYAKFDVAEPALNLTLNASPDREGTGALNRALQLGDDADVLPPWPRPLLRQGLTDEVAGRNRGHGNVAGKAALRFGPSHVRVRRSNSRTSKGA